MASRRTFFVLRAPWPASAAPPQPSSSAPTRTRHHALFGTDLVAVRSANLFVQCPGDSSGRQACADPARLEHDNFAADETENGRWNTGGLPRPRRRFNDQVVRMLQGRKKFRQNRVHWKCWLSTH